ncbi:DUF1573 domain-containing protein [Nonlabens sp. Ci31]|jgi:hypothetical protein|uniref:DUF1573 domain-containing protein n=1 Tax=Nonlabens sp. Ci31 TaxID=2608253 RepID=UPI001463728E|nr:DUF1573 domain-containing protein [Nonlabens sp. Ci31]QJP33160.1 DUF1573 domain-containing protein [Nonlabens sp. Ci31]
MKKLILMVAAVATMALTSCNEKAESATIDQANLTAAAANKEVAGNFPEMTFTETEFDFGTVEEGTVVEHEYKFTNTGSAPLIVVNAKGSCGCTVPTWSKEPIAPGAEGTMLVKFNTNGKPNAQTKTVTIKANTESGTESIRIKGFVTPKARAAAPNA